MSHAADLANLFLLCTPAAVVLLVAAIVATVKKRRLPESSEWFLLLAMGCGIGLIAMLNCTLGMSRDWDIAAPFSVGIPVAAIAIWTTVADNREIRQRAMLVLIVATLLQTGAWVALNADAHSAVARFEILEEKKLWGTQACLEAYEELANYHGDRREFAQAAACFERYVALDSTSNWAWLNCAKAEQAAGNFSKAIAAYRALARLGPSNPDNLAPLGVILAQTGHFDEAVILPARGREIIPRIAEDQKRHRSRLRQSKRVFESSSIFSRGRSPRPEFLWAGISTQRNVTRRLETMRKRRSTERWRERNNEQSTMNNDRFSVRPSFKRGALR